MLYSSTFPLEGCRKLNIALKIENTTDMKILQGVALLFLYVEKNPSSDWEALAIVEAKSSGHHPILNKVVLEMATHNWQFQPDHIHNENTFEYSIIIQRYAIIIFLCILTYL